jgi:hypothetical protein
MWSRLPPPKGVRGRVVERTGASSFLQGRHEAALRLPRAPPSGRWPNSMTRTD